MSWRWIAVSVAVLLAAGAALALLGASVLGVGHDTRSEADALRYGAASADPEPHERGLSVRVGEALLGVADERAYIDAAELAKSAGIAGTPEALVVTRRAEAEALLSEILRGEGGRLLRARAANLLGVLLFEDAKAARGNARRYLEQSLGGFQDAARLDPTFAVAKANLEVLSRLPAGTSLGPVGSQGDSASSSGGGESGY